MNEIEFTQNQLDWMKMSDFKLLRKVGRGGIGFVYKAKYIPTNKIYALKMVRESENIILPYKLSLSLNHPNLVEVYNFFYENIVAPDKTLHKEMFLIIVMEYLSGRNLYKTVMKELSINIDKCFYEIIKGLSYLHSKNISHRDIKPENIMICRNGNVKIIDYDFLTNYTTMNKNVGSVLYGAPEIHTNDFYDKKVDLWSLGILLWFCNFASEPFDGETVPIVLEKIIKKEPAWSRLENNKYKYILKGLLEKDPEKRMDLVIIENKFKDFLNSNDLV